ncbi:MAG: ribonuclease III domain-containing protein [Clostridia bacterium]|nr:ribonuclease III domain-containing protein [Clostridia bacterium]
MEYSRIMEFTKAPNLYNPLVLAYIGDSLYDVYVRSRLIAENGDLSAHKLHVEAIRYVKAHGQSAAVLAIEDKLTEDELSAYKRGRNTKSFTVPKNADVGEYRRATGFEALLGWLYVRKETDRLDEIMEMAYNAVTE